MMRVQDIELSGADYFLFAMDRVVRSTGDSDSPCRVVIHLDGKLEPEELRKKLILSPVLKWMTGAQRSTTVPFTLPRWQNKGKANTFAKSDEETIWQSFGENCSLLEYVRNNGNTSPLPSLSFAIEESGESSSSCILNWHHALMDAHGAEHLLKHLAPDQGCDKPERLLNPMVTILLLYDRMGKRDEGWQEFLEMADLENWPGTDEKALQWLESDIEHFREEYEGGLPFTPNDYCASQR